MAEIEDALKALEETHTFLEAQQSLLPAEQVDAVVRQQCQAWCLRLSKMHIDMRRATEIIQKVQAGPWSAENKIELTQSINEAILKGGTKKTACREKQTCFNFGAYLTKKDLEQLRGQSAATLKLDIVTSRMVRIGLHLPTEQTSGHILTAAACGLQMQVGKQSVEMLDSMKKMLKSKVKKLKAQDGAGQLKKIERVVKYPSEPSASMIESLYDQDDKPEKLDGQVFQSLEVLPLRKSSKLYDRGSGSGGPQTQTDMQLVRVKQSAPASNPMGNIQPQMLEMFQMFQMFQQRQRMVKQGRGSGSSSTQQKPEEGLAGLQIFGDVKGKKRKFATPPSSTKMDQDSPPSNEIKNTDSQEESKGKAAAAVLSLPRLPPPLPVEKQAALVTAATEKRQKAKAAAGADGVAQANDKDKKPSAKKAAKTEDRKIWSKGENPPVMEKGAQTTYYRGGKAQDRCDRKVKIDSNDIEGCWKKALAIIDAFEDIEDVS
ncbi:MBD domain-containing protein [Durusdinium trenchii]|uniref:MBD domain-containing protein n=1 Tax=Durusdinium trenchii TaxID=1381693 RepID=A0ABP0JXZ5_9DINO